MPHLRQSLFRMIKLDEQASEDNIPVQPQMTQKKAPRMPELQTLELEAEKQYLAKLRNQREKIEQLYKDYDKAILRVRQQQQQLDLQKNAILTLNAQLEDYAKYEDILRENTQLRAQQQKSLRQISQLKLKVDQLSLSRSKGAQQIKQFFMEQVQTVELQNSQLRQTNQQLEIKISELDRVLSRKESEIENHKQIEESLRKEISNSTKYIKNKHEEFQQILRQRDTQAARLKEVIQKLEAEASQQNIFIELERQKSQQIQLQFNGAYATLKKQNLRLAKQLERRTADNKNLAEELEKLKIKSEQSVATVKRLDSELELLRSRQQDRTNMFLIQTKQAERKQGIEKTILNKEISDLRRAYTSLQLKYEKLKALNKNRQARDYLQKQIQHFQREQIDRLEDLLQL